jgi:hypothetical protein
MLAEEVEGVMEVCNICLQELDVSSTGSALVFSLTTLLDRIDLLGILDQRLQTSVQHAR